MKIDKIVVNHESWPIKLNSVSLFYCCKEVFTLMNIWMIGKNQWNTITWKRKFYSHLHKEDITDADYEHTKRVCKDFEIKNLGEYHDFYVQSHILLLADAFENFVNMCLKIYELGPTKFLSALG